MAQTKRRRRRKHRGTQSGSIDRRGRAGRPRSRQEARARARKQQIARREGRRDTPPTWSSAVGRAALGAALFLVLMLVLFKRPAGEAVGLAALMLVVYIPMGFYIERFFWRRRQMKRLHGD